MQQIPRGLHARRGGMTRLQPKVPAFAPCRRKRQKEVEVTVSDTALLSSPLLSSFIRSSLPADSIPSPCKEMRLATRIDQGVYQQLPCVYTSSSALSSSSCPSPIAVRISSHFALKAPAISGSLNLMLSCEISGVSSE